MDATSAMRVLAHDSTTWAWKERWLTFATNDETFVCLGDARLDTPHIRCPKVREYVARLSTRLSWKGGRGLYNRVGVQTVLDWPHKAVPLHENLGLCRRDWNLESVYKQCVMPCLRVGARYKCLQFSLTSVALYVRWFPSGGPALSSIAA